LTNLLTVLSLLVVLAPQGRGVGELIAQKAAPVLSATTISPDLSIVTELSTAAPYVGQQFSVIYWLRARRAPVAVDIDPQQFPGFWTEVVPIPPDSQSGVRSGSDYSDFLLRQIIAFPLVVGPANLPSLSVKIKRAGYLSARRDDWDVVAGSEPVSLQVLAVPEAQAARDNMPLVGNVKGTVTEGSGRAYRDAILELEGTANLALFRPEAWLPVQPGLRLQSRLLSSDNLMQILDTGGKRRLTFLMRQRWSLRCEADKLPDLVLPFFMPQGASWTQVRIPGIEFQARPMKARAAERPSSGQAGEAGDSRALIGPGGIPVAAAGVLTLLVLAFALWKLRKLKRTGERPADGPATLERKMRGSPGSFLDAAHRAVRQYARQHRREHDLGKRDTMLDQCWRTVEQYRFASEPPTLAARTELLNNLRILTQPTKQGLAVPHRDAST
jgi:hypothetical protein